MICDAYLHTHNRQFYIKGQSQQSYLKGLELKYNINKLNTKLYKNNYIL